MIILRNKYFSTQKKRKIKSFIHETKPGNLTADKLTRITVNDDAEITPEGRQVAEEITDICENSGKDFETCVDDQIKRRNLSLDSVEPIKGQCGILHRRNKKH